MQIIIITIIIIIISVVVVVVKIWGSIPACDGIFPGRVISVT